MQAKFERGCPLMLPYTPGADIAAGEVVTVGDTLCIAHSAIASGVPGSVAVFGGVYTFTSGAALSAGAKCYWDNTAKKVAATAGSGSVNKLLGRVAPGDSAAGADESVEVIHSQF